MPPASSAPILAASPSALTNARLIDALKSEAALDRIRLACGPVDAAVSAATSALRITLAAKPRTAKVRAAHAAARDALDAAEATADATAAAMDRDGADTAAKVALGALARALYADRLIALADGVLWTGSGYAVALANAAMDLSASPVVREVHVPTLGADGLPLAHVVVDSAFHTGEPYALTIVARTASRSTFDAYRVYVPEPVAYGADAGKRREVELNLTATRLTAQDAAALAEAANVAASVCAVVARYCAAYPERTAMQDAEALMASGGTWTTPDLGAVYCGPDPRTLRD